MIKEDLSASVPEGFGPRVEDPRRPGVRSSDLPRVKRTWEGHVKEPAWLKWMVLGLLGVMALPFVFMGWWIIVVVLLAFIAAQLWRIARRR